LQISSFRELISLFLLQFSFQLISLLQQFQQEQLLFLLLPLFFFLLPLLLVLFVVGQELRLLIFLILPSPLLFREPLLCFFHHLLPFIFLMRLQFTFQVQHGAF